MKGETKAAGKSLPALFDGLPWYFSVPQKVLTNLERIDSSHSPGKANNC